MKNQKTKEACASNFLGKVASHIALSVAKTNVNTTSMLIAYQPKMPLSAKKLRKF